MEATSQKVPPGAGTASDAQGIFKSPIRLLVRFFRKSQQQWRKKAIDQRAKIKSLEHKVRDLDKSRACWKNKAQQLEEDMKALEDRVRVGEAERAQLQVKIEELESKKA